MATVNGLFSIALLIAAIVLLPFTAPDAPLRTESARVAPDSTQAWAETAAEAGLVPLSTEAPAVPRVYLKTLPPDWPGDLAVKQRKRLFVAAVLPLILAENERIRETRQKMQRLLDRQQDLNDEERAWLRELAAAYRLAEVDAAALRRRVDIIPADLALAQAAIESGWGTSRFARQGNALFGQWVWGEGQGIVPKQRKAGMTHSVRKFDSLRESVAGYMRNLNTHNAYRPLRTARARQRANGEPPSGVVMAQGLGRYSERGQVYVDEVTSVIRYNDFDGFIGSTLINVEAARIVAFASDRDA